MNTEFNNFALTDFKRRQWFTESLLLKYHDSERISAWDLYNAATDLYKADSMDIPALMPQNRAMVQFLNEQFNL